MGKSLATLLLLSTVLAACSASIDDKNNNSLGTTIVKLPKISAAISVVCSDPANCPNPMANFELAGCTNKISSYCTNPIKPTSPFFIDGSDYEIPTCQNTNQSNWACKDEVLAKDDDTAVYGIAWDDAASVVVHHNSGYTEAYQRPRGHSSPNAAPGSMVSDNTIKADAWKSFVEKVSAFADVHYAAPARFCFDDEKGKWGTADDPKIILVDGVAGAEIKFAPGRSIGSGCATGSAALENLEGNGILLIRNVQFQVSRNFLFKGLVIVEGSGGAADFFSDTQYAKAGESYIFGATVLLDTLPDLLTATPVCSKNPCKADSPFITNMDFHGGIVIHSTVDIAFPRFRYSTQAIEAVTKALLKTKTTTP
ncbi:MAG: hypothetical protein V1495_00265 [Pseudomonadota bacterium]